MACLNQLKGIFPGLPWTETKIRYNKKFILLWAIYVMTQADVKSILIDSEPTYITSTQKRTHLMTLKNFCRNENYNKILPTENYPFYLFESCRCCMQCNNLSLNLGFPHCSGVNTRREQCRKWINLTPSLSFCSWEEIFSPNGNKWNRKTQKDKKASQSNVKHRGRTAIHKTWCIQAAGQGTPKK